LRSSKASTQMIVWPSLPPTATMPETVWTAASMLGLLVAVFGAGITSTNLRAARRSYQRARQAVPAVPLHTLITWQAARNELLSVVVIGILAVVLALFVGVGVLAMLTTEPQRPEVVREQMVTISVLVAGVVLFVVISALLTIGSLLNRRDRHELTNRITGRLLREQMAHRQAGKEG
jgi:ABC-type uncharacterized transport system fused permease/ATPase subunit